MPEGTEVKPADGTTGTPKLEATAAATGVASGKPPRTFSQDELDAIVEARLKRAIPSDYDELKALKVAKDADDESKKTELQRAQDAEKEAKKEAKDALTLANTRIKRATLLIEAQGTLDPGLVADLLVNSADISVDKNGTVTGTKEAVAALLKEKPYLAKGGLPGKAGGEFGGVDKVTGAEKIKQLEREAADSTDMKVKQAKLAEARDLKQAILFNRA